MFEKGFVQVREPKEANINHEMSVCFNIQFFVHILSNILCCFYYFFHSETKKNGYQFAIHTNKTCTNGNKFPAVYSILYFCSIYY